MRFRRGRRRGFVRSRRGRFSRHRSRRRRSLINRIGFRM